MKKICFALVALLTMAMVFTSCDQPEEMEVLAVEDITADWVENGTWSGTYSIDTNNKEFAKLYSGKDDNGLKDKDIDKATYNAEYLKDVIEQNGKYGVFGSSSLKYVASIEANKKRTHIIIKQGVELTYNDEKVHFYNVSDVEKD